MQDHCSEPALRRRHGSTMLTSLILTLCLTLVSGADHELYEATTRFSQRLWRRVIADQKTAVMSPPSIHMNLCMAAAGASGPTLDEIKNVTKTIAFDRFRRNINGLYLEFIQQLQSYTDSKVYIANTLLAPEYSVFKSEFNATCRFSYQTYPIVQTSQTAQNLNNINQLVKAATKNLVSTFFPASSFSYDPTSTYLLNLCVTNATWLKPFPKQFTSKRNFTRADGTSFQLDFMNDVRVFNIRRNFRRADILEIPFTGGRLSFFILKPRFKEDFLTLETFITSPGTAYNLTAGPFVPRQLKLSMPKFKLDTSVRLQEPLTDLGINLAFDDTSANNSAVADGPFPILNNLNIPILLGGVKGWTEVNTRSLIEVNEVGTVINATGTVTNETLPPPTTPPMEEFNCNTPFMFYIIDKVSKFIVLQGKLGG